jgi:tocopherol O-methyltransferase
MSILSRVGHGRSAVDRYYDHTWWDFRFLWFGRGVPVMHFGHYDATTRRHAEAIVKRDWILAQRVRLRPGDRVLDAGCGAGGSSIWLARRLGATVVGLALSFRLLPRARAYAQRDGVTRAVTFVGADYGRMPFGAATFDVVWAVESLCHAPDKSAFYREAARVLRPGGRVVVAEYMRARPAARVRNRDIYREWLDNWAIPDLDSAEQHAGHATAAGFTRVAVEDATDDTRPSLRRLYRLARYTYPLALAARLLRIRTAVQHGNVIGSIRQYEAMRRGEWLYGILSATMPAATSDRRSEAVPCADARPPTKARLGSAS